MVEGKRRWRLIRCKEPDSFRVITSLRGTSSASDINSRHDLSTRIAIRSRINTEQRSQLNFQGSLFQRFAHSRLLDRFTDLDKAARERPSKRRIFAIDESDSIVNFYNHIGGDWRTYWTRHGTSLTHLPRRRRHIAVVTPHPSFGPLHEHSERCIGKKAMLAWISPSHARSSHAGIFSREGESESIYTRL